MKLVYIIVSALLCCNQAALAKSNEEKAKEFIDEAAGMLKGAVDKFGDNLSAIQYYLDHYPWKGVIEDESTTDPVTLKQLHLNGHSKIVVVRPGERIEGRIKCKYDADKCSPLSHYRVIVGIKDHGAQTTIGSTLGALAGETSETFVLIAPPVKGVYQVCFQPVEAFFETGALSEWRDPALVKPIGFVIVN